LTGKFLLSLNDTPEVREIFSCFEIEEVSIYYSVQAKGSRQHQELLIANYPIHDAIATEIEQSKPRRKREDSKAGISIELT